MNIKRQHEGPFWRWSCSHLDYINVNILVVILNNTRTFQNVTTGGNWAKCTLHLSVIFLIAACASPIISAKTFTFLKNIKVKVVCLSCIK